MAGIKVNRKSLPRNFILCMWLRGSFNNFQRAAFLVNFFHKAFKLSTKLKFGFEQHNPIPQTAFAPVPLRDEILLKESSCDALARPSLSIATLRIFLLSTLSLRMLPMFLCESTSMLRQSKPFSFHSCFRRIPTRQFSCSQAPVGLTSDKIKRMKMNYLHQIQDEVVVVIL